MLIGESHPSLVWKDEMELVFYFASKHSSLNEKSHQLI